MLNTIMTLLPSIIGSNGGAQRFRRGRRPRSARQVQDDLGKWIWIEHLDPASNSYIRARKSFQLPAKPTAAAIMASADSRYKLYVNGHYVGKGPVRSGSGYTYYDTYDITDLLDKGANVIAFLVHNISESTYSYLPGKPGLICKVDIETPDDTDQHITFGTDESWMVCAAQDWTNEGIRISHRLGFQEVYNAEKAQAGWNEVKFKEKGWESAAVIGTPPMMPWGKMMPREIPPLSEVKVLPKAIVGVYNAPEIAKETPPAEIPELISAGELIDIKAGSVKNPETLLAADGQAHIRTPRGDRGVVVILDFGREVFGNVEIGISGSGRGCIDIGYAELLEDGRVKPTRGSMNYTDRVSLNKGKLEWQGFDSRAFRYMQIEFRRCSKPVAIDYIRVNQTTYPIELTGSFECSDRLLNDIWQIGAYTAQLCMEDTFIDSPWRERAQWWGDARIESRVAYYAFNDTKLLAQGLRQIASSQNRDGAILGLYPAGEEMLLPDFSLFWVFSILDYFGFTDDAGLVKELYPSVKRLMRWFDKYTDTDGLLADVPGQLFIDWADLEKRGEVTALNCLYHQGLRVAAILASITGRQDEAETYMETARNIKLAINKFMYLPKRGLYAECRIDGTLIDKVSRQTNILAALFDIPDQYQKSSIQRRLINGSPLPEITTPYFASHLLEALYAGDQHKAALDYIRRKWGEMVKSGAMTFLENFNGEGSLCHGWATCPTRDLLAEYIGIKPVLGAHRFSISPHPADLRWAKGTIATNNGPLTVDWRTIRSTLEINVNVPDGLKVDVYPPGSPESKLVVDGKAWPSRFVTFSAGKHRVKVTPPRLIKSAVYDEALMPLVPRVELMNESISPYSKLRLGTERPRRRIRKRASKAAEVMEVRMDADVIAETRELESEVEELIETAKSAAESEIIEIAEGKSKRKPRRRGGRRHARARARRLEAEKAAREAGEQPTEATQVETTQPNVEPVETPVEQPTPEVKTEPAVKRRTPRRRGGRRSAKTQTAPQAVPEAAVEQPEEPTVRVESVPALETPTEQPSMETSEPPAKKPARRRGGRRSSKAKKQDAAETVVEQSESSEQALQTESTPAAVIEQTSPAEKPKRTRRSYSRKRKVVESKPDSE